MPSPFEQLLQRLQLSTQRLEGPSMQAEQRQQDLNPSNFGQIDKELARPGNNQMQNETLMNERQRLEAMQLKQLQKSAQQFAPRLAQSLDIQTHTGMPLEGPAEKMAKLLLMMKKIPSQLMNQGQPGAGQGGRIPGINPFPVQNPNPSAPVPPMGGIRG